VITTGKTAEADVAYIDAGKTLRQAGHLMRELGVGALEVRAEDGRIQGTISREMVVRRIAAGGDPKTVTVGEVAAAPPYIPARPHGSGARKLPGLVALRVPAAAMTIQRPLACAVSPPAGLGRRAV
jgi:CBS domain-containing protein